MASKAGYKKPFAAAVTLAIGLAVGQDGAQFMWDEVALRLLDGALMHIGTLSPKTLGALNGLGMLLAFWFFKEDDGERRFTPEEIQTIIQSMREAGSRVDQSANPRTLTEDPKT